MNKEPFVTVIMPIRNEIKFIKDSLHSVINQDYNENKFEIIISDGISNDGTYQFVKEIESNHENILVLKNQGKIVPTGFNEALSISKGEIIIRVDGHCIIEKDFISKCIEVMIKKNTACVGGSIENISFGFKATCISIAQCSKFGVGGVSFREKNMKGLYVDTLAFGAYKRSIFNLIGPYDEELIRNQDDEFNFRLNQSGEKIWLDPSIKSSYHSRSSFKKLFLQYFGYGKFKVRVMQKRNSYASFRHLVPMLFVLSFLVSSIFYCFTKNHQLLLSLATSYFAFAVLGSSIEFFKTMSSFKVVLRYIPSIVLIMFSYFIIHFSYGIGFLWPYYFSTKWKDRSIKRDFFDEIKFQEN